MAEYDSYYTHEEGFVVDGIVSQAELSISTPPLPPAAARFSADTAGTINVKDFSPLILVLTAPDSASPEEFPKPLLDLQNPIEIKKPTHVTRLKGEGTDVVFLDAAVLRNNFWAQARQNAVKRKNRFKESNFTDEE